MDRTQSAWKQLGLATNATCELATSLTNLPTGLLVVRNTNNTFIMTIKETKPGVHRTSRNCPPYPASTRRPKDNVKTTGGKNFKTSLHTSTPSAPLNRTLKPGELTNRMKPLNFIYLSFTTFRSGPQLPKVKRTLHTGKHPNISASTSFGNSTQQSTWRRPTNLYPDRASSPGPSARSPPTIASIFFPENRNALISF